VNKESFKKLPGSGWSTGSPTKANGLLVCFPDHVSPLQNISSKSVLNVLSDLVDRQTDRQTDRQR